MCTLHRSKQHPHGRTVNCQYRHPSVNRSRTSLASYSSEDDSDPGDSASVYSDSAVSNAESSPESWVTSFSNVDLYGAADEVDRKCYIPVVNLWLDLAAHVSEKDIPSPVEFLRQYEAVTRCVRRDSSRVGLTSVTEGLTRFVAIGC